MRSTLLIGCLALALGACADAGDNTHDAADELAAVGQSPWVDDAPTKPPTRGDDPWSDEGEQGEQGEQDNDDNGDPWLDPPRTPPRNPPAVPAPAPTDAGGVSSYDFEESKQGWTKSGPPITNATRSTAQHAAGTSALEVSFDGAGTALVSVPNPALRPGATVSFRIYVPAGARLNWIQPFVQRGPAEGYAWTGAWTPIASFRPNTWTTVTLQAPADARSFATLGVQFETAGSFRGRVYIDDVRF
jgi:hypothetical protein